MEFGIYLDGELIASVSGDDPDRVFYELFHLMNVYNNDGQMVVKPIKED